jgi:hypothetical protein
MRCHPGRAGREKVVSEGVDNVREGGISERSERSAGADEEQSGA